MTFSLNAAIASGVLAAAMCGPASAQDLSDAETNFVFATSEACTDYFFESWSLEAASEGTGLEFTRLPVGAAFPGPGGAVTSMPVFTTQDGEVYVHENIAVGRCEVFADGMAIMPVFEAIADYVTTEKGFEEVPVRAQAVDGVTFRRFERVVNNIVFFVALAGTETGSEEGDLVAILSFYPDR